MKKILIFIVMLLLVSGCGKTKTVSNEVKEAKETISNVTCDKAMSLQGDGAIIVDVREPEEYKEEHLDEAINIPYTEIVNKISNYADKDTKIIVYCKSGVRSNKAATSLVDAGYKNIYDLGSISNCK